MRRCFFITIFLISIFIPMSAPIQETIARSSTSESDNNKKSWPLVVSKNFLPAPDMPSIDCMCDNLTRDRLLQACTNEKRLIATHKQIVRRYIEDAWNQGDMAVVDELVAANYAACGTGPGKVDKLTCLKSDIMTFRSAFPDGHFTIDTMVAEGDKVVVIQSFQGTHLGRLPGVQATGEEATWTGMFMYRIEDGKIAERWPK